MIKNTQLFIIGLVLVGVGAATRHVTGLDDFGLPALMLDYRLWVGVGAVFFIGSLVFEGTPKKAPSIQRGNFEPVDIGIIGEQVKGWTEEGEPDIPLIVDFIIYQAIHAAASDIHFDPSAAGMNIRYRRQGLVRSVAMLDAALTHQVINRLKVISNLVIYKDVVPQDGRFRRDNDPMPQSAETLDLKRSGLHNTDFRIAFMPTLHGERIVIRILGTKTDGSDLASLGMRAEDMALMQNILAQPQGMLILTGPTGSGKTTTIFAAIAEILEQSGKNRSVATLEDPIEFDVPDINQSQVNEERDFTFQKGLRAILRQDPDVIMVGEIRDAETAQIAVQAGMTGHLLITTVHAGNSAAAFTRMLEMGIPPYSLNSSVTAVVAQRLVRKICPHCVSERDFSDHDLKILRQDVAPVHFKLQYGRGCDECENTGYKGRTAIYELLEVNEPIRKLISAGADSEEIYQQAQALGMKTLWESALEAVQAGETTLEEVERNITSSLK